MRSFLTLSLLTLGAALGVNALAYPHGSPLCPEGVEHCAEILPSFASRASNRGASHTTPFRQKTLRLTNAQRLARGLPLNSPGRRGSPTLQQRQAEPSGTPEEIRTGVIGLMDGEEVLGYLSATTEGGAMYRLDTSLMAAAVVSVTTPVGAISGTDLRLSIPGSDIGGTYPLLGLVQGRDNLDTDIGTGSYHYLYLAGVALPGSTPSAIPALLSNSYSAVSTIPRAAETDVWDIDFITGVMTPQWVNSDGSTPSTVLFAQGTNMYAGGDMDAFSSEYNAIPTTKFTLRFIM